MNDIFFWGEFVSNLFTGRFLLIAVMCLVGGYLVGWSRRGLIGHSLWAVIILVTITGMVVMSDYFHTLLRITETGARIGFDPDTLIFVYIGFYMAIYAVAAYLGYLALRLVEEEGTKKAKELSASYFVTELNAIAAHPEIAKAGWFPNNWLPMEEPEREAWVAANLDALRVLWVEHADEGLLGHGVDLPMELARVDQSQQ